MAESLFKNEYSTTTLLGMVNQAHGIADLSLNPRPETTLNAKHNIFPTETPTGVERPKFRWFTIGIRGFYNVVDDDTLAQPYIPSAKNMDLYEKIPFRLVPVDEDISETVRNNGIDNTGGYRLRVRETHGGQDYFAYYAKEVQFSGEYVRVTQTAPNGEETLYSFDTANLNPTPVKLTTPDVGDGDATMINVSVAGTCTILGQEVMEAINVLKSGNLQYARFSEIGLVTGLERSMIGLDGTGSNMTYDEAVYTQLLAHSCTTGIPMDTIDARHSELILFKNSNAVAL